MGKKILAGLAVVLTAGATLSGVVGCQKGDGKSVELLNVSYDPTRELWQDLNSRFIPLYEKETGVRLDVKQSHGGSSSQARSIIDGLEADVATLALWSDTDALRKHGLIKEGWEERLPHRSLPYFSTIVFVVRKGNPQNVHDWPDLVKPGVKIITPNPKTSGNGKWSFLAAWGAALRREGSDKAALEYVTRLYQPDRLPVLENGARGATITFAQKNIGDVHLTWENEAHLEVLEARGDLELVYPPVSIRAEPYVAVVDANVDRRGTRAAAEAYLKFLYTDEAQEIIAKHYYRPINAEVLKKHTGTLRDLELFPATVTAPNLDEADKKFFADGGVFDTIYRPGSR